jgi:protein-S-isoprenylcysteine O-methyltransferase Ste14
MRKPVAVAGTATFFFLAPGIVAGAVPWWLVGWELRPPLAGWAPLRAGGLALLAASLPVLAHAFARFALEGAGTPAPVAPTARLVVGGLYRHVRNPMYLAVVGAILGQALLLGQTVLLAYAALVAALTGSFARFVEEPMLRRRFGAEYEAYRSAVPAWWPRWRPWSPR